MAEKMHSAPTILVETVGLYETNCYYVFPRNDGPLFIIDPGAEPEKLYENTRLFPTKEFVILLTHAHVDHISGAGGLAEKLGISRVSYESKKKSGKFTTFEIKTLCKLFKCKFDYLFETEK